MACFLFPLGDFSGCLKLFLYCVLSLCFILLFLRLLSAYFILAVSLCLSCLLSFSAVCVYFSYLPSFLSALMFLFVFLVLLLSFFLALRLRLCVSVMSFLCSTFSRHRAVPGVGGAEVLRFAGISPFMFLSMLYLFDYILIFS